MGFAGCVTAGIHGAIEFCFLAAAIVGHVPLLQHGDLSSKARLGLFGRFEIFVTVPSIYPLRDSGSVGTVMGSRLSPGNPGLLIFATVTFGDTAATRSKAIT